MKVLVTGATGYIGSHTVVELMRSGIEVVGIDNFSKSHPEIVSRMEQLVNRKIEIHCLDLCNKEALDRFFLKEKDIDGLIHFAAFKSVPESVEHPLRYYYNNINSLTNVLSCVDQYRIPHFVFSSSCSVYGNSADLPVTEESELQLAESVYGFTKQLGERIISDAMGKMASQALLLRYFNPAGADSSGLIGEWSKDEPQNLVPRITGFALGKYPQLIVYGNDYPTADGSCIRDFIHVTDLAQAHVLALKYLESGQMSHASDVINLGSGKGYSVLELIHAFEKVSGIKLNYRLGARREGDPIAIYANCDKAFRLLNWKAGYTLDQMLQTSWQWEKNLQELLKTGNK